MFFSLSPASSSSKEGFNFFKMGRTLPLKASPQILSLGKTALSIIVCGIFSFAKKREAVEPAGPAPIMVMFDM
jgi:hypothetical protein